MRPGVNEKRCLAICSGEGIDGSRILDYRIPISYDDGNPTIAPQMQSTIARADTAAAAGCDGVLWSRRPRRWTYQGEHDLHSRDSIRARSAEDSLQHTGPILRRDSWDVSRDIPEVERRSAAPLGGLLHAEASVQKGKRARPSVSCDREKLSAVGSFAWGANYPKEEFTASWKRVLFLQFHDSPGGTALPEHYKTAREGRGVRLM